MAKDSTLDVAILKVDGKDFFYLTFADSENLKLGQTVIAIGNALARKISIKYVFSPNFISFF